MRVRRRLLSLSLILVVAVGSGCANAARTDPASAAEVAAIETTLQTARDALVAGDVPGFMKEWTDSGLQDVFYESGNAFVGNTGYYLAAKQYRLGAATSAPVVLGDSAAVVAPLYFRLVGPVRKFSLVKQGGIWVIDGAELASTQVTDTTAIGVAFKESSIRFETTAPINGDIALQVRNPTARTHQLNILTAPPDQDVVAFFEDPESAPPVPEGRSMPEGFDFVGGVVGIEPGMTVTVLMYDVLPPGRYVLFCNEEDNAGGGPHSMRGEYLEFTIR
ncbi:MAG: hypothetical protein QFC55_01940 [Chloroflexota bacterium]|nr:hypothetical protein [Chloroflexota bacterium]